MLVLEKHLEIERIDLVEAAERPFAHRLHVAPYLGIAQERDGGALGAWRERGVIHVGEVRPEQLAAGPAADPEVLERGDVAQVPDERGQQRSVLAVEVLSAQRLYERKRALAGFLEKLPMFR
jgi:hypothetical protein